MVLWSRVGITHRCRILETAVWHKAEVPVEGNTKEAEDSMKEAEWSKEVKAEGNKEVEVGVDYSKEAEVVGNKEVGVAGRTKVVASADNVAALVLVGILDNPVPWEFFGLAVD